MGTRTLLREAGVAARVPASPWVSAERRDEGCSAGRAAVGCQSGTRLVSTSPSRNCPSCVLADRRQGARRALQGRERKGSAGGLLQPGPKLYPLSARVTGEQDRYPLRPACRRRSVATEPGRFLHADVSLPIACFCSRQEVCYLCMQRDERNRRASQAEERLRKEREEERVWAEYQARRERSEAERARVCQAVESPPAQT